MNRKWLLRGAAAGGLVVLAAFAPVGGGTVVSTPTEHAMPADLSSFSSAPLEKPLDLVFLHHSIGSHLLADPGPDDGQGGTHPNGGGLRRRLTENGYRVHEATYGSALGERTDLFDWLPKFRDRMQAVLRIDHQDRELEGGRLNRVVLFKSCYPNNQLGGPGTPPGNPSGPALDLANARAALEALLPVFEAHPDTLFVYLGVPPLAPHAGREAAVKWLVKKAIGRPSRAEQLERYGALSRQLNDWTVSPDGWLNGYPKSNVVVFDYYGVLTDDGASNLSRYPAGEGDSHPSSAGNRKAAALLPALLNRAVRRAGLAGERSEAHAQAGH